MGKSGKILSLPWVAVIIIIFAALTVYSNAYRCPFVFDDIHSIAEEREIRDLSFYADWQHLLHSRTIVDFTFALNYRFGRLDVFGYHLVNILIHIANGFMVYLLSMTILGLIGREVEGGRLKGEDGSSKFKASSPKPQVAIATIKTRRAKKKDNQIVGAVVSEKKPLPNQQSISNNQQFPVPLISLFAALIFVAHPIQTQAVTYIVQRYASMAAFFYMAAVLFYLKARLKPQTPNPKTQNSEYRPTSTFSLQPLTFYLLSFACGLLAFMSKQNAASLPGAILLVEWVCFDGTLRERGTAHGMVDAGLWPVWPVYTLQHGCVCRWGYRPDA